MNVEICDRKITKINTIGSVQNEIISHWKWILITWQHLDESVFVTQQSVDCWGTWISKKTFKSHNESNCNKVTLYSKSTNYEREEFESGLETRCTHSKNAVWRSDPMRGVGNKRQKKVDESTAEHRVKRLIIKISGATVHIVNIQLFLQ